MNGLKWLLPEMITTGTFSCPVLAILNRRYFYSLTECPCLFILSPLEFGLLPELFVFMFAHFLLAPFFYVAHSPTSFTS
jgi:hypothetical protein